MPAPTLETRQGLLSSYLIINLTISVNSKVIIIAEAGVNHNGDIKIAFQLIDAAKEAGADYVKFQTFIPELLVSKDALKSGLPTTKYR
jgi:sialic acid synthase SpsE